MPSVQTRILHDGSKTYYVRVRDPVRRKETSETFDTKREAQQFCEEVKLLGVVDAIARLSKAAAAASGPKVDDLFDGFIAWKSTRVRSDRTIADYRRDYKNWIQPALGQRVAHTVNEQDVQAWVESMVGKLAPKSVVDRHSVLFGTFGWGVRTKKLTHNPCIGTDLPKRRKSPPKGLRPAEWQALYAALKKINPDAADLALFLISTGWRFSEATALSTFGVEEYDDVVLVSVDHVVRRNAAGQHVIVEDTKSEAGGRRVALGTACGAMIRRRMQTTATGGLVLTTRTGAQWHHSNFRDRAWKPAVEAANLQRGPTPHWLRHSHVYWLDLVGAPVTQIQKRIGHENITTTTGTYGSMIGDVAPAVLAALEQLIGSDEPLEISSGTSP